MIFNFTTWVYIMMGILRKFPVIIITFFLILLGSIPIISNVGASSFRGETNNDIEILDIEDYAIDENNDTSYDNLYLSIRLNIKASGQYHIYASMSPSGVPAGDDIPLNDFTPGEHYIKLQFSGTEIYESGHDGPYDIFISIYMGPDLLSDLTYETEIYKFEEFNPVPEKQVIDKASIEVINNTIKLKTEIFSAVIYELTPMIRFYYSTDDGQTASFKVTYQRIICFSDQNKDGIFQETELRYSGNLITSHWSSQKALMENFNSFDFKVQTIVTLQDIHGNPIDTKLKLAFHYSSATKLESVETAQKFDISIKLVGGTLDGITHIALEHELEDEFANHEFFEQTNETKISFLTFDGKEHGFYSWRDTIEVTPKTDEGVDVTHNLELTSNGAVRILYLNYPYTQEITEINHDPVVGVNPNHKPTIPGQPEPKIIRHEIIIYLLVAIIVAVIMIGNIYRQRKRR